MKRFGIGGRVSAIAISTAAVLALCATTAAAAFVTQSTNTSNSFATATLVSTTGTPSHPTIAGGTVRLTWTPGGFATSYTVQRATLPSGSFTNLAPDVVAANCSSTCTFDDTSATYNSQYKYQLRANFMSWTATGGLSMALSRPPASGSDATGSGHTLSTTEITALSATGDSATYDSGANWPKNKTDFDTSRYIEIVPAAPASVSGAAMSTVKISLAFKLGVVNANAHFELLVSTDDGATYPTAYSLANPGTTSTNQLVNVGSQVTTFALLQHMRFRFLAYVSDSSNMKTTHDLFHVDVN